MTFEQYARSARGLADVKKLLADRETITPEFAAGVLMLARDPEEIADLLQSKLPEGEAPEI